MNRRRQTERWVRFYFAHLLAFCFALQGNAGLATFQAGPLNLGGQGRSNSGSTPVEDWHEEAPTQQLVEERAIPSSRNVFSHRGRLPCERGTPLILTADHPAAPPRAEGHFLAAGRKLRHWIQSQLC